MIIGKGIEEAVAVAVCAGEGSAVSVAGKLVGLLEAVNVGAAVGVGTQPASTRPARMIMVGMVEKISDFFVVNSPCDRRNVDILQNLIPATYKM